uniref:Uncharacterized protein n=1 Tax=viral metagenome TaxID=1070528 RepID=A0A6M3LE64_9ZZZZ
MREATIKVYKYEELEESVKQKALEKLCDINVDYEWWEFIYDDAERIGLKIEEFELDRGAYCKGEWIEGAEESAEKILREHGEGCETYKDALRFRAELEQAEVLFKSRKDYDPEYEEFKESEEYEEVCEEFLRILLEDYRIILQKDYDWLTSEEAIVEMIEANEYEFTKDGKIM